MHYRILKFLTVMCYELHALVNPQSIAWNRSPMFKVGFQYVTNIICITTDIHSSIQLLYFG